MRVLVCDDDRAFRRSLIEVLMTDGLQTFEAGGGYEAITIARKVRVDFGIFDCKLPDLDGPAAIQRMRAEAISFPFVLMSGDVWSPEQLSTLAGLVAFLSKPLDVAEIRKILRDFSGSPPPGRKGEKRRDL
jgi:CheY-like chemotaxis protein